MNDNVQRVSINNQDKSINITENGSIELFADGGYTGLGKVVVNTNVASGGGSDMPVIGDGKTYLYIKIAAKGRMDVPLYFSQTVGNGVTIDWGDGSAPQTLSGEGYKNTTHKYKDVGEYTISLNPADGCTLELGSSYYDYSVMGSIGSSKTVYCNMLQAVEIGNSVTSIKREAFKYCYSLASVVIPNSVTSIGSSAFYNCASMAFYDFSQCTSVPTLGGTSVFSSIPSDCKIVVPDALYDEWIAATNWSSHASRIVKASEFNA